MTYFVYILASETRTLYIGITSNLYCRIKQHREKKIEGFTKRYNITKLVYAEYFYNVHRAIARETQLKGYARHKKIKLIESKNLKWKDLSADWTDTYFTFDSLVAMHEPAFPPTNRFLRVSQLSE